MLGFAQSTLIYKIYLGKWSIAILFNRKFGRYRFIANIKEKLDERSSSNKSANLFTLIDFEKWFLETFVPIAIFFA